MLPTCDLKAGSDSPVRALENAPAGALRLMILSGSDSDALFLSQMAQMANFAELAIETSSRLASGSKRLGASRFDLILLDVNLADASGLEAFRRVSALAPMTPIVVVVSMEGEQTAQEAVRCGAQDYLVKEQVTPHFMAHTLRCAIERQRQLLELKELSMTDPLTGLYNRRGFWALADSQIKMTRRQRRRSLILCADLDGLKQINDKLGHDEGDRAIVKTAEVLQSCFRESDIVARFGGDEFVALAYDAVTGAEQTLSNRIRARLKSANHEDGRSYDLSLSIGTAVVNGGKETSLGQLLEKADRALYRNKRKKGNRRLTIRTVKPSGRGRSEVLALVGSTT